MAGQSDYTQNHVRKSRHLLIYMPAQNVAMFRFLLEAYENLALFTVVERRPSILMLSFAEESRGEIINMLNEIASAVEFTWTEWPFQE